MSRGKQAVAAKVEEVVQAVSLWSEAKRLQLSAKCEVISMDPREAGWTPEVSLGGRRLWFEATPKFLGVTFDRSLSFRPRVENVVMAMALCDWADRVLLERVNLGIQIGKVSLVADQLETEL